MIKLKTKRLSPDAKLPTYGSDDAACFDLYAAEDTSDFGGVTVGTGLAFEIPEGYEVVIRPRSGLAFNHSIHAFAGTLDSDYRGEVKVLLYHVTGAQHVAVSAGDRIAQASLQKVNRVSFEEVTELSDTARGEGGFGSTGK